MPLEYPTSINLSFFIMTPQDSSSLESNGMTPCYTILTSAFISPKHSTDTHEKLCGNWRRSKWIEKQGGGLCQITRVTSHFSNQLTIRLFLQGTWERSWRDEIWKYGKTQESGILLASDSTQAFKCHGWTTAATTSAATKRKLVSFLFT